jgi:membrane-bound serine protease (ClpP class)
MMPWKAGNIAVLCAVLAILAGGFARGGAAQTASSRPFVAEVSLNGPIGPAAAEYFDDAARRATRDGADAIVLRLDTPGGLTESMRHIISTMLASNLPVLCYVSPAGARAASAGTYILYACQIAAMAPATHLGAATPVTLGGKTPMPAPAAKNTGARPVGDAESNKVLNDAIAYVRSLAQLRGRNPDWAEQAVRGAATLTASEAAESHVVDFVASDVADVLRQSTGRSVRVGQQNVTLSLANQTVRPYTANWRTSFLEIITDPTIAYVLLLAGLFGLILEGFHPGAMLPGIAGVISLLIGMYALQMLPVNYAGLALMTVGVGLLIAEIVSPTIGVLGVGGVIAFVLGSIMLMNTNVPGYSVNLGLIAGMAFAAIIALAMIMWIAMRARRMRQVSGDPQMLGAGGALLEPTDAGGQGWAQINGERWQVLAGTPLSAGTNVRVVRRDGLLLWVIPD